MIIRQFKKRSLKSSGGKAVVLCRTVGSCETPLRARDDLGLGVGKGVNQGQKILNLFEESEMSTAR